MSPAQVRRAPLALLLLRLNEARQAEGLITRWSGGSPAEPLQSSDQVRHMLSSLRQS